MRFLPGPLYYDLYRRSRLSRGQIQDLGPRAEVSSFHSPQRYCCAPQRASVRTPFSSTDAPLRCSLAGSSSRPNGRKPDISNYPAVRMWKPCNRSPGTPPFFPPSPSLPTGVKQCQSQRIVTVPPPSQRHDRGEKVSRNYRVPRTAPGSLHRQGPRSKYLSSVPRDRSPTRRTAIPKASADLAK